MKILLSPEGRLKVETSDVPPVASLDALFPTRLPEPGETDWKLRVDTQPTIKSSFTKFKTTQRLMYDSARIRGNIHNFAVHEEVLLWNEEGEVMEGSLTTCYFLRDGKWVTPRSESGTQNSTVRRWVLEQEKAAEASLKREGVKSGEWIVMSNGVRGVWGGWIV